MNCHARFLLLVVGFVSVFMDSAQECMPVKTVCVRTDDAPWMTNEIRLLIKQRVKMHKKAITDTGSNLRADWDNFRTFRNNVISKVRKRKLDYFDELTGGKKSLSRNVLAARIGGN